jgi:hypothetical protein
MERQIVMQNVDYLINDFFDGITSGLGDNYKKEIYNRLDNVKLEDMSQQDAAVIDNNNNLLKISIYILVGYLCGAVIISALIAKYKNINYFTIFFENFVLLLFIGLCEYVFLVFFGSKFISANTNFIKGKISSYLYNPDATGDITNLINMYTDKFFDEHYILKDALYSNRDFINYINEHPDEINALLDKIILSK